MGWMGCGGDGSTPSTTPAKLEGSFAQITGAQPHVFSLAPDQLKVLCRPKPALGEFEYEAATHLGSKNDSYFHLLLRTYSGPAEYDLPEQGDKESNLLELGWTSPTAGHQDFLASFSQELRVDNNPSYNTACHLSLAAEEQNAATHFTGVISCGMLWPKVADKISEPTNSALFIDLVAHFECDY
jgi:hypothetical protein